MAMLQKSQRFKGGFEMMWFLETLWNLQTALLMLFSHNCISNHMWSCLICRAAAVLSVESQRNWEGKPQLMNSSPVRSHSRALHYLSEARLCENTGVSCPQPAFLTMAFPLRCLKHSTTCMDKTLSKSWVEHQGCVCASLCMAWVCEHILPRANSALSVTQFYAFFIFYSDPSYPL